MWWKYYVLMYVNGKMIPVETMQGLGGEGIMGIDGGSEFNCEII
jgi:hypothetical protein